MAIPDMPNTPPQNVPVLIAQANQAQSSDVAKTRSMGVCFQAINNLSNLSDAESVTQNGLNPKGIGGDYFYLYEHHDMGATPALNY